MHRLHSPISNYSGPELQEIDEDDDEEPEEEEENGEEEVGIPSPPSGEPNSSGTPTAAVYRSFCTAITAKEFADRYGVPPEYELCAPTSDQRANDPPPGYAAIYTLHFQNGLRLPLPPFVVSVLANYKIALAQLHPNSIITLLGFMEMCEEISVSPTTTLFRQFFRLQRNVKNTEGWYIFFSRPPKIVFGQPSSVKGWKSSFLFFKTAPIAENVSLSWNCSPCDPPLAKQERPSAQIVSKFKAIVKDSSKRKQAVEPEEEERAIEMDVPIASFKKSRSSTKSSTTESPSAACGQKRLKRMAESHATKSFKTPRGPTGKKHLDNNSKVLLVPSLKGIPPEQFARYIQKCVCSFNLQLQGDKEELEKIVAAREQDIKDKNNKIASLEADKKHLQGVCNDRGTLLKVYTCKLLKTLGFAKFFKDLTTPVRSLGHHEAATLVQKRCPDIPKEALEGLEDPLAALKLDNQFFDMVQDDGLKFPLLDHLLSLEEIPSSSQLKVMNMDEDEDALMTPKALTYVCRS